MQIRRWFALGKLSRVADEWPIKPGSEQPPKGWPGWPEGRNFAFVLTHDVESQKGVDRVKQLAALEMEMGFRSKFNFIPEGSYSVPAELRGWLVERGFEVGVHDLHHDGRLYASRSKFRESAQRINRYLEEWGAVGFRSGFMFHRLDWLHDIDICYDASTFDTDPFEPQPDGCGSIFPFWVDRPPGTSNGRTGYVEMPYTLPQDSTLFLLLQQPSIDVWKKKLDWVADHGGMALVNIHPDYIDFTGRARRSTEYPVSRIRELLEHLSTAHSNRYWSPLPKQAADWFARTYHHEPVPAGSPHANGSHPANGAATKPLAGKRAGVLLYSYYPADPRPRRAAEAMAAEGMEVDLFCLRENRVEPWCE
jgi:hypothetical protein